MADTQSFEKMQFKFSGLRCVSAHLFIETIVVNEIFSLLELRQTNFVTRPTKRSIYDFYSAKGDSDNHIMM